MLCELLHTSHPKSGACWLHRIKSGRPGAVRSRMGAMNDRSDFRVRRALAIAVRKVRQVSAAIALSLGLGAGSIAHAGVPLPIVAETTGMPSLAAVVKRIAP